MEQTTSTNLLYHGALSKLDCKGYTVCFFSFEKTKTFNNSCAFQADQFKFSVPSDFYESKTDESEAEFVNSTWPHKYPGSQEDMKQRIIHLPTFALRRKSDDEVRHVVEEREFLLLCLSTGTVSCF